MNTQEKPIRAISWLIWFVGASFFLYQFLIRLLPGRMVDDLMEHFTADAAQIGTLASAYYITYAAMQIPTGILIDKFGPRKTMTAMAALTTLGHFIFMKAPNIHVAEVGRLIIGAGSAAGLLGTIKLINLWFPKERLATIMGFTITLGTIGATFSGGPLAALINKFGWHNALNIIFYGALILVSAIWLVVRDRAPNIDSKLAADTSTNEDKVLVLEGLKIALTNLQAWLMALSAVGPYMILALFADLWGSKYMEIHYGISEEAAGFYATSLVYLGLAAGGTFFPFIARLLRSYRRTMLIMIGITISLWSLIITVPSLPLIFMNVCLFVLGMCASSQIISLAEVNHIIPLKYRGIGTSTSNMMVMLSVGALQHLSGPVINWFWESRNGITNSMNIPIYTADDFRHSFILIIVVIIISGFMAISSKETYDDKDWQSS